MVVRRIERERLITTDIADENSHRVTTQRNFAEMNINQAKNKLKKFVQEYRLISSIMLKVEIVTIESDKGSSPALDHFYSYWKKRVYNAIVQMIIRPPPPPPSITSFYEVVYQNFTVQSCLVRLRQEVNHLFCSIDSHDYKRKEFYDSKYLWDSP